MDVEQDQIEGISIVPSVTKEQVDDREIVDYHQHREQFINWLLTFGKDPEQVLGYRDTTAKVRAQKADQFYRWVWDQEGRYTTNLSHTHADEYMKMLAFSDLSQSSKPTYMKSLKSLYQWRHNELGDDEWEPDITFTFKATGTNPRDYLTSEERRLFREAALEYGRIPSYYSITPSERRDWKAYLARRFEKPMDEVSIEDWDRANGWKYPSMVWVSLDAGLRPSEVERSTIDWLDLNNDVLRIPKSGTKNDDHWVTVLQDRTVTALEEWLKQRENYEKYNGRDELWLTKYGNPYNNNSLSTLAKKLADIANIDRTNRQVTWYSIRRGMITEMIDKGDLSSAQIQARHKDIRSTLRYDQAPPERRKKTLNKMG